MSDERDFDHVTRKPWKSKPASPCGEDFAKLSAKVAGDGQGVDTGSVGDTFQSSGTQTVRVNGKTYTNQGGGSINIINGKVYINGKLAEDNTRPEKTGKVTTRKVLLGDALTVIQAGDRDEVRVHVDPSVAENVVIHGDEAFVEDASIEVYGGSLRFQGEQVTFDVYLKRMVPTLKASGGSSIRCDDASGVERLAATGVARIVFLGGKSDRFQIETSGTAQIESKAKAQHVDIEASGASQVRVDASSASIEASGTSKVLVDYAKRVSIEASGVSQVTIPPSCQVLLSDLSGMAKVIRR